MANLDSARSLALAYLEELINAQDAGFIDAFSKKDVTSDKETLDKERIVKSLLLGRQLLSLSISPIRKILCKDDKCLPKSITNELITRRFTELLPILLFKAFKGNRNDLVMPFSDLNPNITSSSTGGGQLTRIYSTTLNLFGKIVLYSALEKRTISGERSKKCECNVYNTGVGIEAALLVLCIVLTMTLNDKDYNSFSPGLKEIRNFTTLWSYVITNKDVVGLFCNSCGYKPCHSKLDPFF